MTDELDCGCCHTGCRLPLYAPAVLQSVWFQLTQCLAVPVDDVPYVCHAASLDWIHGTKMWAILSRRMLRLLPCNKATRFISCL